MTTIRMVLQSKKGVYLFHAVIHGRATPEDFHMEPVEFYETWGGSIPAIPHHEIEVTEPKKDFLRQYGLHIHASRKDESIFVCYPRRIGSLTDALQVFRTWCLGSVATIAEQIDLNTIHDQECGRDAEKMRMVLRERYGIFVVSESVS